MQDKNAKQIAIVGAGMSGLAAARLLAQDGLHCTIYEKSRGVGGRAATRRVEGFIFDHGAQYVKAPSSALHDLVTSSADPAGFPPEDIRRPVWVFDVAGTIAEGDPAQNSDPKWSWRSGITALGKTLAAGLDIRFETSVAHIARSNSTPPYTLFDNDGTVLGLADAVLCTPPAPQTAALLGASKIDPDLCRLLLDELAGVTYRRCISITFAYAHRPVLPWYALVNSDRQHPISWLACEHDKAGHAPDPIALLTAQMSHEWSMAHWDGLTPGTFGADGAALPPAILDVHSLVQTLVGNELGQPLWANLQRWRYALPEGSANFDRLNRTGSGLYVAGDSLTGIGRVHLAIESGWRIADLIKAEVAR
jgi:predicted NAD/FAD-dependent oxidoreductase